MALVKKFNIFIEAPEPPVMPLWHAFCWIKPGREDNAYGKADDLNRAICECVAKMQASK